jgi:RNA polymerase primary sigma factor
MDTIEDTSMVSTSDLLDNIDRYEQISERLEQLTDNERKILAMRFGLDDKEPQTLDTIGQIFGVTRERIRQIESKSLEKIRSNMKI